MKNLEILTALSNYLLDKSISLSINKNEFKCLRDSICRVLAYKKDIPAKAYQLISDKRYHKEFSIIYGFKWTLSKIEEPSFKDYYVLLQKVASKLKLPIIDPRYQEMLLLNALIIQFFEEQPHFLESIQYNPSINLLEGLYTNHPRGLGNIAN